ncbi:MAG: tetratricopeptide repeat protein [Lewinellaceae bacterium]|nr:tetratricopeptide repeat protein [Saprospiraceae bacterium]MCB9308106.1 tetratricopeptide repeat protein [Lewinellaceae bacterium]
MAKKSNPARKAAPSKPAPSGASGDGNWQPWVLAAAGFLLFCTGFSNEMLGIDDHMATVDNPAVKNFDFGIFNLGMYAPLTWMGYAVSYTIGGENPFLYHLMSALVHAANVWLLFRLLQRLDVLRNIAFASTLLFAIHPIQVESVAWIAGFSTPLFTLFCLLSVQFYLDHADKPEGSNNQYALSLGMFIAACLAKSTAVVLPVLLLVIDQYWKKPALEARKRWLGYIPFFTLALAFGLFTFHTRAAAGVEVSADSGGFSAVERIFLVCYTPLLYWSKLLWPGNLSIYYSFDKTENGMPALYYAAPVLLAVVAYAAWHFREKAPWLRQGLLFYAANIFVALPYYSVGAFELCADHYNYLAAVGIFYLLVSAWSAAQRAYPAAAGGIAWAGRLWAVALVVMSLIQIRYWKDTIAIVDNAIEKGFHQNGRMYEARAIAYANDRRDMNQAMRDFNKALEINPKLYDSYKYRGSLYGLSRQYEKSVADLDKYLESKPDDAEQYYNRGLSLLNLDRTRDAIRDFNKTLEINPDFARAYRARGNAYLKIGDTAKADADLAEWERRNNGRR